MVSCTEISYMLKQVNLSLFCLVLYVRVLHKILFEKGVLPILKSQKLVTHHPCVINKGKDTSSAKSQM